MKMTVRDTSPNRKELLLPFSVPQLVVIVLGFVISHTLFRGNFTTRMKLQDSGTRGLVSDQSPTGRTAIVYLTKVEQSYRVTYFKLFLQTWMFGVSSQQQPYEQQQRRPS
jgi:hypothetical protein